MGFVKYAVHRLGTAVVDFSANHVVPQDMKLGPRQEENARTGMYYEWIAELASYPKGGPQQFWFALQTLCTAVKFHSIANKQRSHSIPPIESPPLKRPSLERPIGLGS